MNIWLSEECLSQMRVEAAEWAPLETGGILLGYVSGEHDVVVNAVIGSGPKAKHYRHRYEHDSEYERAEASRIYMRSGAPDFYLGDWHTHPGGRASMSWLDRKTLAAMARKGETIPGPITLILGEPHWEPGAWRCLRVNIFGMPLVRELGFCRY
jgi:integrative and conjugative element protein (TIGR02256 family)